MLTKEEIGNGDFLNESARAYVEEETVKEEKFIVIVNNGENYENNRDFFVAVCNDEESAIKCVQKTRWFVSSLDTNQYNGKISVFSSQEKLFHSLNGGTLYMCDPSRVTVQYDRISVFK